MNKKLFLLLLMASGLTAASAQMWVGGELSYQMNKTYVDILGTDTQHNITFAPEIGNDLNDKWSVAAKLQFSHEYNINDNIENTFSIRPYVRYYWGECGKLRMLLDGGFEASSTHARGEDYNINSFGLFLTPGVTYSLNDRIGLVAHMGAINWTNKRIDKDKDNTFNFRFNTEFSLGFFVNL